VNVRGFRRDEVNAKELMHRGDVDFINQNLLLRLGELGFIVRHSASILHRYDSVLW
jgi:hypothetical protein